MSSPLRSCEEDEGMVLHSEGGDFDEEDEDEDEDEDGRGVGADLDRNASDINSPAAPRESATTTAAAVAAAAAAAPGRVESKRQEEQAGTRSSHNKYNYSVTSKNNIQI